MRWQTLALSTVEESSEFAAQLKSRQSITLYARVDGHITKIFVAAGDNVSMGQEIMEIDPLKQAAAVSGLTEAMSSARADLETASETLNSLEATRVSRQSNLAYSRQQVARYTALEKEGAVAKQDMDQWSNQGKMAEADLQNTEALIKAQKAAMIKAEKSLKQAQANLKAEQVQLNYHVVKAPFAGMIGDIPVKVGDYVLPITKLTILTKNKPLEASVSIPTERSRQLHLNMNIALLDGQGHSYGESKVMFIAPSVDEASQSILVKSFFPNTANLLRADQLVRARVIWGQHQGVLVPTTAVVHGGGQDFAFIAQSDGKGNHIAKQVPIKLGEIHGNNYEVVSGLRAGDTLIVSGIQNLSDNAPVVQSN